MRLLSTTLLIGVVAAAVPQTQQILGRPKDGLASSFSKSFQNTQEHLKTLSDDIQALWDEVSTQFPEAIDNLSFYSMPKKHTRRPDSHWDHIVRGSDIQNIWITNADGQKEREVDGKLESYDLRVKKVDPSSLGVDPDVKQYSGYLDDNANDKHLFYCKGSGLSSAARSNIC